MVHEDYKHESKSESYNPWNYLLAIVVIFLIVVMTFFVVKSSQYRTLNNAIYTNSNGDAVDASGRAIDITNTGATPTDISDGFDLQKEPTDPTTTYAYLDRSNKE